MTLRTPSRDRDRNHGLHQHRGLRHHRRPAGPPVLCMLAVLAADSGHDRSSGTSQETGRPTRGGNPAPAPAQGAPGALDRADGTSEREHDGRRTEAPPADHLSTFALAVDTASWGYARRTLADGSLPDPGTVRPEELVNSFRQDYRQPDGDGFSVTSTAPAPTPRAGR